MDLTSLGESRQFSFSRLESPSSLGVRSAASRFQAARQFLSFAGLLIAVAILFSGCGKKPAPLNGTQIRAITREIVMAARNVTNGRVQTGMFPERIPAGGGAPPRGPGQAPRDQPPAPPTPADLIYITLPQMEGGKTDEAALSAVVDELTRIAQAHNLTSAQRRSTTGIIRYEFSYAGQRTHTVNIVTPLIAPGPVVPPASDHARLAIIIDDLGYDPQVAEAVFQLPFPLTLSVLPHLPHSTEIAEEASRRGFQVMLHLPIEANGDVKPETIELRPGMDPAEVTRVVQGMLATVPQAIGVNNHQGSLGTSDAQLMDAIMPALRERDLFFVDSRTAPTTVAYAAARRARVPTASRDVFLDDADDPAAIHRQLDLAIHDARLHGEAVAIGHPRPATLAVLSESLPQISHEGVALVFVSQLVR